MIKSRYVRAGLTVERILQAISTKHNDEGYVQDSYLQTEKLRAAGFNVLGRGCFGYAVRYLDDDFVIKVVNQATDGYRLYAKWAQANPQAGVVRVFYIHEQDGRMFVALPVLQEVHEDYYYQIQSVRDGGFLHHESLDYLKDACRNINGALDHLARRDMHCGNFMYDPELHQYVVTDPYAEMRGKPEEVEASAFGHKPVICEQLTLPVEVETAWPSWELTDADVEAFCSYLEADRRGSNQLLVQQLAQDMLVHGNAFVEVKRRPFAELVGMVGGRFAHRGPNPQQIPKTMPGRLVRFDNLMAQELMAQELRRPEFHRIEPAVFNWPVIDMPMI